MMFGTIMNEAGSVTRGDGRSAVRLAAVLVAASLGLAGLAGCGSSGDAAAGQGSPTSASASAGKAKTKAGTGGTEGKPGLDAKQTGRQELRWKGVMAGYDNANEAEYVHMADFDWRNTGNGDAKASRVFTCEATTPSGKKAVVTFDYQTPSTDVTYQSRFKPEDPTLKPGEEGSFRVYIHMPWEEVKAVPTPKNPMQLTIRDNGGSEFHWTVPVLPIQDGMVSGDGITPADPNDALHSLPTHDWVK